jgi:hypothetical protein
MGDTKKNKVTFWSVGFTEYREDDKTIKVSHAGNMGNSVDSSVNPNLHIMKVKPIADLKLQYPNHKEQGSPDYDYLATFHK